MLRNFRTQRFLGTPFDGVLGSTIPATGDHGASVMYNDINPAIEAYDRFRFRLTSVPAGFFMFEDGSFIFAPSADGTYTATGVLMKNGTDVGAETITLQSGANGVTVSCTAGAAGAVGVPAAIIGGTTISCVVGAAVASGATALIAGGTTVSCTAGTSSASGPMARIDLGQTIGGLTATATATGAPATVASIAGAMTISCAAGDADARGMPAVIAMIRLELHQAPEKRTFKLRPSSPSSLLGGDWD